MKKTSYTALMVLLCLPWIALSKNIQPKSIQEVSSSAPRKEESDCYDNCMTAIYNDVGSVSSAAPMICDQICGISGPPTHRDS